MPQIAQQDYLRVDVQGATGDAIRAALPQERATELAKRNVLSDVVLVLDTDENVTEARIVSFVVEKVSGDVVAFTYVDETANYLEY